jgi:Lrp/AsnC family leucine-responsive transcriptional regulator
VDLSDLSILQILQRDNRRSAADVGREVGLSVSAVSDRIRRLNTAGTILANRAVVDPSRAHLLLCAFLFIDLAAHTDESALARALREFPEVQEAHHITGPHSWLLKVRVRDSRALQSLLTHRLKPLPGVMRTETIIVLDTAKETTELALRGALPSEPNEDGPMTSTPATTFAADSEVHYIGTGLLNRTLPKSGWNHRAHLAAAAWMIVTQNGIDPTRAMPGIIRAYNEVTGVPNTDTSGYHETITQASLRVVRGFIGSLPSDTPLHIACNALLASRYGNKHWLLAHWTEPALFSAAARRCWVEPDLAPLPF